MNRDKGIYLSLKEMLDIPLLDELLINEAATRLLVKELWRSEVVAKKVRRTTSYKFLLPLDLWSPLFTTTYQHFRSPNFSSWRILSESIIVFPRQELYTICCRQDISGIMREGRRWFV